MNGKTKTVYFHYRKHICLFPVRLPLHVEASLWSKWSLAPALAVSQAGSAHLQTRVHTVPSYLPHTNSPTEVRPPGNPRPVRSLVTLQKACLLHRVGVVDCRGGYWHTFPSPGYTIDIRLAAWFICVVQWSVSKHYMCHIWTKALQVILGFATIHFPLLWTQREMGISFCVLIQGSVWRWDRLSPEHNRQAVWVKHKAPMSVGLLITATKPSLFQLVYWTEKKKMWELTWVLPLLSGPWVTVQLLNLWVPLSTWTQVNLSWWPFVEMVLVPLYLGPNKFSFLSPSPTHISALSSPLCLKPREILEVLGEAGSTAHSHVFLKYFLSVEALYMSPRDKDFES